MWLHLARFLALEARRRCAFTPGRLGIVPSSPHMVLSDPASWLQTPRINLQTNDEKGGRGGHGGSMSRGPYGTLLPMPGLCDPT